MRNIQKAIQPIYQCEQNQPITLYEGEIEFLDDSKAYQGYGEITFNWLPNIKVKFSFQDSSYRSLDFTNDISLRLWHWSAKVGWVLKRPFHDDKKDANTSISIWLTSA